MKCVFRLWRLGLWFSTNLLYTCFIDVYTPCLIMDDIYCWKHNEIYFIWSRLSMFPINNHMNQENGVKWHYEKQTYRKYNFNFTGSAFNSFPADSKFKQI